MDSATTQIADWMAAAFGLLCCCCCCWYLLARPNADRTERQRQFAALPSVTPNAWKALKLALRLSMIRPRDIIPLVAELYDTHGPLVHMKFVTRNYILLNDPNDIKNLLSSFQHITKGPDYKMLEPWLNKGLLTSTGKKWHDRRKLLTGTFHFKVLETYIPTINEHSRSLVKNLIRSSENDKPIEDIEQLITLCALDIVCETIMGVNLRSQEGYSTDYVRAIKSVSHMLIKRILTFWYWMETIFNLSKHGREFRTSLKLVHDFTEKVIQDRRAILVNSKCEKNEEYGKKRVKSFLDLLVAVSEEQPDTMTDKDIQEEVDTFLFEGHDTSSIVITMAFIHLGFDQNVQNAVRDELSGIFGDSDRYATIEDLKAMSTLDRVIRETMRLYPSVTGITRTLHDPLYLDKYTIPAESIIVVVPHQLHRDENLYPNPEKFDPDRFLPEECAKRHPFAYLPFSAGPRNCIGQKYAMYQMKIILSTILRHVKIKTLGTQKDIVLSTQLILRADYLPSVRITPI